MRASWTVEQPRAARWGLALALLIVVVDQFTKWLILAVAKLSPPGCLEVASLCSKIEVSSVVDLTMVWNYGVSFGLLEAQSPLGRWLLVAFSTGVAIAMTVWLFQITRGWAALALAMVIGGAVGNVIDRIRFGAVVDFFDFSGPWFGWVIFGWPVGFAYVFNVADAAISIGVVVLLVDMLFDREPDTDRAKG